MSEGPKMSLAYALNLAERMVELLRPDCERIEIAGSVRRKKSEVGDIEIVLIPRPFEDFFGEEVFGTQRITFNLECNGYAFSKNGQFFKQVHYLPGEHQINFDIFLTTPEKWGAILAIRTGSADFSHWLVTSRQQGGACPSRYHVKDGRVWWLDQLIDTPEETDFFRALELQWLAPELRTGPGAARRIS